MADLVLGPLMQILIDKLASPILQKFQDRHNLKHNIRKLQQSVPRIQALLEDAQRQQQTRHAVKQWLAELEDAACESEALLDELAAEVEARERRTAKGKEVPGLMFFPFKPSDYLFDLASQLQIKLRELDQIAEQALSFDLQHKAVEMNESFSGCRETMSCLLDDTVYGRDEDKQNVLNFLLHDLEKRIKESSTKCPSVISVVGIGGVGKTTLAYRLRVG